MLDYVTAADVTMCKFKQNHHSVIVSVEKCCGGVECLLQNLSASSSAEYINVVPIDVLEGLFPSVTESELHTADSVVDSYTRRTTSTNENQVQVDEEFIEIVVYDKVTGTIDRHLFNGLLFHNNLGNPAPERLNQSGF